MVVDAEEDVERSGLRPALQLMVEVKVVLVEPLQHGHSKVLVPRLCRVHLKGTHTAGAVSYTHLTLPTKVNV